MLCVRLALEQQFQRIPAAGARWPVGIGGDLRNLGPVLRIAGRRRFEVADIAAGCGRSQYPLRSGRLRAIGRIARRAGLPRGAGGALAGRAASTL